ncbi:hypothetical protein [Bradyrhizobium sp. WSM1253]|uniref:hypothetical protein n=1 Tax=Bradyrhizobium sp. WSM1253 TaxID=319003 RepID=UPI00025D185C|nr:hypothetical protein [Bradyrhizobium sp. WSM1253]EIG56091.1 hypothetical protein Bra1253DRAFT_00699 [Bradyrhizobium sp. WSM1253]
MDSFSATPATGQPEAGERISDSPSPVASPSNVIDLDSARAAATATALAEMIPAAPPSRLKTEEELDRVSAIMRAAVTYTSINGAINGAWRAEHTGNSTVAEIVIEGMWERRNAVLRKLTRLMKKASAVRTVELWSLASLADIVMDQQGDEASGGSLEPFEIEFMRSLFRLVERDCESRERSA